MLSHHRRTITTSTGGQNSSDHYLQIKEKEFVYLLYLPSRFWMTMPLTFFSLCAVTSNKMELRVWKCDSKFNTSLGHYFTTIALREDYFHGFTLISLITRSYLSSSLLCINLRNLNFVQYIFGHLQCRNSLTISFF